jgi:hypothetical protein
LRLNRAMISFGRNAPSDLSRSELIRDRLSSRLAQVLDAAEPSASFATSLTKILPVIRLCAIMLASITPESDSSQVLSDAYVQVFASHHQWRFSLGFRTRPGQTPSWSGSALHTPPVTDMSSKFSTSAASACTYCMAQSRSSWTSTCIRLLTTSV